jgi:hypothetical protein
MEHVRLRRRTLLKVLGSAPLAAPLVACAGRENTGFLDEREQRALAHLADLVLPPGGSRAARDPTPTPGGAELGVVAYVDALLAGTGLWFASGPYSGRTPLPARDGTASADYPDNDFAEPAFLDRTQRAALHRLLFGGPALVPGEPDDVGLRALFREHLAHVDDDTTLDDLAPELLDVLVQLTSEGAFASPEYGGNPNGAGWQLVRHEGDRMPFGFSTYDETTRTYKESARWPVSRPNPGPDPEPLDDEVRALLSNAIGVLGGRERT